MKFKTIVSMLFMLSVVPILSCSSADKFSGKWVNETIDRELFTITKSDNGYTIDAPHGSFPCVQEDKILKCKMGFGDTVLHIDKEGSLVMTTPVGMQLKFKKQKPSQTTQANQ